jgi:hypothetical protein
VPRLRLLILLLTPLTFCGCNRAPGIPEPQPSAARAAQSKAISDAQNELAQVPLPAKSQYLSVHSLSSWQNPYLTVQANVITLHVMLADANPSSIGIGGMTRPVAARREELTLRPSEIPNALSAIPAEAWPYGRVIAVEEMRGAPKTDEPAIRRNLESTLKTLNDLGLVVDEWNEQNGSAY